MQQVHGGCAAVTFQELAWATSMVGSRAYRVRGSTGSREGDVARLLPVIDMLNHGGRDACVALGNVQGDLDDLGLDLGEAATETAVQLSAIKPIRAGQELTICYGHGNALTNERLLLEYGFTLDDNPGDDFRLPFGAVAIGLQVGGNQGAGTACCLYLCV